MYQGALQIGIPCESVSLCDRLPIFEIRTFAKGRNDDCLRSLKLKLQSGSMNGILWEGFMGAEKCVYVMVGGGREREREKEKEKERERKREGEKERRSEREKE